MHTQTTNTFSHALFSYTATLNLTNGFMQLWNHGYDMPTQPSYYVFIGVPPSRFHLTCDVKT